MKIDKWISNPGTIAKSKKYYAHFDYRTDIQKVEKNVTDPEWVSHHGFYPFIHYEKDCTKYNRNKGKNPKKRDICYASHIDRCILQYYCHLLNERYNEQIRECGIEDVAVAYRSNLGLNNIHLAKRAFDFIKGSQESFVMIGDFTGFFDNLDHKYLKAEWCKLLDVEALPPDHYNIFKNITRYSKWELGDLLEINGLPENGAGRRKLNAQPTVLTKEQFRKNKSHIEKNKEEFGIPQGSPISALLANVYMMDVDIQIKSVVDHYSGMYMRYSDDFIIVLRASEADASVVINKIYKIIECTPGLKLEPSKTQIYHVDLPNITNVGERFLDHPDTSKHVINFLGFTFNGTTTALRAKTVSKYYYRMYRKAHSIAANENRKGKDHLYQKYSERGAKASGKHGGNFFTYVHRAEKIFGDEDEIGAPVKNHMAKISKALKK